VEALKVGGRAIRLVCAGTEGQVSLGDSMGAGALAHEIDAGACEESEAIIGSIKLNEADLSPEAVLANDQAEIVASLWRETESIIEEGYSLADALSDGK